MTDKLQQQILEKIKCNHVTPKKKWHFLAKDSLVWISAGFVVVLGAAAVATILAILAMGDWDVLDILGHSKISYALMTIPYAWLLLLLMFVAIADFNIRQTKSGYRISLWKLVGGVVGTSVVLGVVLFAAGVGVAVDSAMTNHVPLYEKIGNRRALHLMQPEQGTLTGRVDEKSEEQWKVTDPEMQQWIVIVEDADIIHAARIRIGQPVRILGELDDDENATYVFEAYDIRPLRPVRTEQAVPPVRVEKRQLHIQRIEHNRQMRLKVEVQVR